MKVQAVWLSLSVATRSVLVSLGPALLVAWLLVRGRFPGRFLVDALVHPGHPSTPGYTDPAYPLEARV